MNLKKMIIINSLLTFLLCFLTHFLYDLLPNPIFAIFFPVNESIWEHMKMLYTTILLYSIIEYIILHKNNLYHNNFLLITYLKSIISIPIYLALYLPIYYNIGENMLLNFSILIITIITIYIIEYFMNKLKPFIYEKILAIILIIITYFGMAFLTFKAPHYDLFFDPSKEVYGINDYLIK